MDGNGITMADIVTKVIASGQLSAEEEIIIKKMIEEKQKKMGGQKGWCLAGTVGMELMQKMDTEDVRTREMYQTVYQKCFKENRIGRMDSFKLSESMRNCK